MGAEGTATEAALVAAESIRPAAQAAAVVALAAVEPAVRAAVAASAREGL